MASTDRRGFLRFSAGMLSLLGARIGAADAPTPLETALAVHRATRNTALGAVGARIRRWRGPLPSSKPYPGKPRIPLPEPSASGGRAFETLASGHAPAAGFEPKTLSLDALTQLLFLANGVTRPGRPPLRAAPSAGALYACEIYLVASRVEGLEPGVHSYSPLTGDLVLLRSGDFLDEVAGATETPGDQREASLAIAVTSVFERYQVRYANRGYRYALIDTGHIGENLRFASAELGLHETAPLRFEDDHVNALLGVDGREEAVCALHFVGHPGSGPGPSQRRSLVEHQWSERPPTGPGGGATGRYHAATKLVPKSLAEGEPAPRAPEKSSGAKRPAPQATSRTTVRTAIRARRSAARFDATPLARQQLVRLLAMTRDNPELRRTPGLDLYVVAHRVEHTPPGLYRYDEGQRLEPLRREPLAASLVEATLGQRRSGQAAIALIAVARLAEAVERRGERAYRDLLIEAGATAQRVYLAAEALGVAARNLAAFYDDPLDRLLGLDGEREVAVHLTAVGPGR